MTGPNKNAPGEDAFGEDAPAGETSDEDTSEEDTSGEDTSETLPARSGEPAAPERRSEDQGEIPVEEAFADEAFAEDLAGAEDFSQKALSKRTREAYRRAWSDFESYCEEVGRDPLPARPVTVAAYINSRARGRPTSRGAPKDRSGEGLAASTLEQRLAAIKYYHESGGLASPTDHPQVSRVMQGVRNDSRRQEALPRTEAAPLVSSDLKQALEVLPGSGSAPPRSETAEYARWLRGRRDRALLLLGFATALRPRELTQVEKQHVARGAKGPKEGLIVYIPRSKADQIAEGQTVTALKNEANPTYCPVRTLSRWRRAASIEEGPLFRGVRRGGTVLPEAISYRTLNRLVQRACRKAGLEPEGFSSAKKRRYSAHSLRAGHVTDASSHGAPDSVLMMQTRHADPKTLRRYDRPAQQLEESSSAFLGLYQKE
ncbi:tyrosine-type recombinase/integrase [Salinibacter ruber]|uniref:tyrosine-type recombinase/integrase n=1 Tax=Salinibacter ruber TaxID=146919 RepID=UPI0021682618|nr:integrase [Salinibacter ruber]MCS4048115.1 integrase [Salinibacter ruber]